MLNKAACMPLAANMLGIARWVSNVPSIYNRWHNVKAGELGSAASFCFLLDIVDSVVVAPVLGAVERMSLTASILRLIPRNF